MAVVYFDSSAFVKLLVEEEGSDLAAQLWDGCDTDWEDFWSATRVVEMSEAVAQHAGELAREHALRGADAVHLASVLALGEEAAVLAVWDNRLRLGAEAVGLRIAPA